VKGKTQRLSIQTLRYDHVVDLSPRKILLDERDRASALSRGVRRLASYANDTRSVWKLRLSAHACQEEVLDIPSCGEKKIADTLINWG
jgi:hypothetical protein